MDKLNQNYDHKYDDIIHLPHHVSMTRPQIPMLDRAAQFSPFAALTGCDAAIKETGRLTDRRLELSEDERIVLDRKQQLLLGHIGEHPEVSITYFLPDERKSGGAYITVTGCVKKIAAFQRVIILSNGSRIDLDDVLDVDGTLFEQVEP